MSEEKIVTEEDLHTNPALRLAVGKETELKYHLVEYVGTKFDKEEVTVEMIVDVLAQEFPEFMLAIAEENFLRGYKVGVDDAYRSTNRKNKESAEE
jgi:hypothetical protein